MTRGQLIWRSLLGTVVCGAGVGAGAGGVVLALAAGAVVTTAIMVALVVFGLVLTLHAILINVATTVSLGLAEDRGGSKRSRCGVCQDADY